MQNIISIGTCVPCNWHFCDIGKACSALTENPRVRCVGVYQCQYNTRRCI